MPDPVLTADELTAEWLTAAFGSAGVDGMVESVTCKAVGTGQMSGSFRLGLSWASASPTLPSTAVAKLASPDPELRATAGASAYTTECKFYSELAAGLPVPTPHSWYSAVAAASSCFTLLLEDCAPAEQGDQINGCSVEDAHIAVAAAAALHGPTWCDPAMLELPFLLRFDGEIGEVLQAVLIEMVPEFAARLSISGEDTAMLTRFVASFNAWINGAPERFSLLHNDYRLDNLLFDATPDAARPVTVVDWQTLSVGPSARDIAYLLSTSLPTELRRDAERELVASYSAALAQYDVPEGERAHVWDDYVYGLFQAPLIIVLGCMTSVATDRGNDMFRMMTSRACTAIRDLEAIDLLP